MAKLTILLICLSVFFIYSAPASTGADYITWGLAIFWLNSIPFYHYILHAKHNEAIPFLGIWGSFVSFSYSIPVFFITIDTYEVCDLSIPALECAFFSFLLFYIYYFCLYRSIPRVKKLVAIPFSVANGRNRFYGCLFLIVFLLTDKIFHVDSFHFIGTLGLYIYLGTYFILINKRVRLSGWEIILYVTILVEELVMRFLSGQILYFALLLLFYLIVSWLLKVRLATIIFICLLFLSLYALYAPIKYQYRDAVWVSGESYTTMEKATLLFQLMVNQDNYSAEHYPQSERYSSNVTWRFSYQASALSLVLDRTPAVIPYQQGESYQIISKFIPRILWDDKPVESANLDYNIRYGLVTPETTVSPFPLPVLAELYMNFGLPGIWIGMFLLALIYVLLNFYFNSAENNEINKIYGIGFLLSYISIEGNFSMTFGAIPLVLITLHGLLFCFDIVYRLSGNLFGVEEKE